MGCKHCKLFLIKYEHNNNQSNTIEQNLTAIVNNEQTNNKSVLTKPKSLKFSKHLRSTPMDRPLISTLDNLPVELLYHIFNQLDAYTVFTSLYNVCTRLNSVIRTYDKVNLNLHSISMSYFKRVCSLVRPEQIVSLTLSDGNDNIGLIELFLKNFHIESFKRLRSLTLIDIDDNEQMVKLILSITDQLKILTIKNSNEMYSDTVIDILMECIGKKCLTKLCLDIEKNRFLRPSLIWPDECLLKEIKLVGLCAISLLRNILFYAPNLRKFEAFDIDLDDEWINYDDEEEEDVDGDNGAEEREQPHIRPLSNASNLVSLSLTYSKNEMEKLEWLLPQFTGLKYLKLLNINDFYVESIYENDESLLNGRRWEKMIYNCERFEFIFSIHIDNESTSAQETLTTFQTRFWQDRNWNVACEQYDKIFVLYSLPYAHDTHYYDRAKFFSLPYNPFLVDRALDNVTKLRINMPALKISGQKTTSLPRFSNVSQLILDGQWRNADAVESLGSLVHLSKITKVIRLERVPTVIFRTFIYRLVNLQTLTLTTCVLDSMNAATLQYLKRLHSLNIVQTDENYRSFVNVEPFCTMFPQVERLDIPVDNIDSCQYVIDRLGKFLISVVFRFPNEQNEEELNGDDDESNNDDDDDDDDDGDIDEYDHDRRKEKELVEWAVNVKQNHQYRVCEGDIYLWFQ